MSPSMSSAPPFRLRHRRIPGPPPDPIKARLLRLHVALLRRYGPQRWWPGRSAYEIAVGAILTQHTAWTNAALAIAALRSRRLLDPTRLAAVSVDELAPVIRSAGTYRLKARRVHDFTAWLLERFGGRWERLRREPLASLRRELLDVPGLGPETVDAILLYAAGPPVFVADPYAPRVPARPRFIGPPAGCHEARAVVPAHPASPPPPF